MKTKGKYTRTVEHRQKMSITCTGKKHTVTAKMLQRLEDFGKARRNLPWTEARRKAQEILTGYRGRKPIIKNGKEYSEDWHIIRKQIYARDNWHCQECNVKCNQKGKTKIQCHHIDYNIGNNHSNNLIILCAECHMKTNFKRQDWVKYLQGKLKKG